MTVTDGEADQIDEVCLRTNQVHHLDMYVPGKAYCRLRCYADELGVADGRSQRKEKRVARALYKPLTRQTAGEKLEWAGSLKAVCGRRATGKDLAGEGMRLKSSTGTGFNASPRQAGRPRNRNRHNVQKPCA